MPLTLCFISQMCSVSCVKSSFRLRYLRVGFFQGQAGNCPLSILHTTRMKRQEHQNSPAEHRVLPDSELGEDTQSISALQGEGTEIKGTDSRVKQSLVQGSVLKRACHKPEDLNLVTWMWGSLEPHVGGRREPAPQSYPLTSILCWDICVPHPHHTHKHIIVINI